MADNIIRQDIIELSYVVNNSGLTQLNKQMDDLKKSFSGDIDKSADKLKQNINDINKAAKGLGKVSGIDKLKNDIETANATLGVAKDKFNAFSKAVKGIATHPIKTLDKTVLGLQMSAGRARAEFKNLAKTKVDNLKSKISGIKNVLTEGQTGAKGFGNALKNIGKVGLSKAVTSFSSLKNNIKQSIPDAEKLKGKLKDVGTKLTDIGKKAAGVAFNGLKKLAGISFKAVTAGIGAAATAIGGLVYKSVQAYGDYEQLVGGVETLLGAKGAKSVEEYAKSVGKSVKEVQDKYSALKDSENMVLKNANDAYKTAGLSANEYMETVTGFSASLLQSLGGDTKKAAEYADMAVKDMADNANKMGTDMGSIQWAYQGFAKQNYTMLDNLKLGYGGTKSEMERLVKDAAKLDKSIDSNSLSYGNIVKAIHAVQVNMDIYGTTQKEAEHTITGSLNAMKASWGNLLTAMASGKNLDQCIDNMVNAVETFGDNVIPVAEKALGGIGTLIERLVPKLEKEFPKLAQKMLPPLIKAAVSLTKGLIKALPSIVKTVATTIVDIFGEQFPIIGKIGKFFEKNAGKVANSIKKVIIPAIIALVVACKGLKVIQFIKSLKGGDKGGGGIFSGITNMFKGLAETDTKTVLKGMANLAIILGGLGTLVWIATKVFKQGIDMKQMLKVIALIGVFGIVGGVLGKFAGTVGNIPVTTVLKGMANMAIVLVGLGALVLAATKVFNNGVDFTQMLKVAALIGIFGVVGSALSAFAGIVGLIPIALVLKGLANMAIVLGGMGAVVWAATKVFSNGVNIKQMLQVVALIGVFGVVGGALSAFASIIGLIPIILVIKGLANMAIVLVGMGALLFAATKLFKNGVNFAQMYSLIKLIGVLGLTGSALSVLAGVVGLIPIPVVLAGLTNIGLVLGGMSALIVAFGKLTQISGFTYFIEKGGEILVKICDTIGRMAGALVSGAITQISEALPTLGENLGKFGAGIKPLFDAMQGIDMGGVGAFFTSLGGLLGIATGNGIIEGIKSLFGGGEESALSKLGTDLSNFATNAKGFFEAVATFPENGFTNAKLLFETLSGISNLPKSGGIKQWFGGETDYEALANGLKTLSSERVTGFFTKVATLPENGFTNAKTLFKTLSGIGDIPKSGGFKQWFSGETDYSGLASGLKSLSSKSVVGFFNTYGAMPASYFTNAKNLFKALGEISDLPKMSGLGGKGGNLTKLGEALKTFGDNAQGFFEKVNALNVTKLNALWSSIKSAGSISGDTLKNVNKDITEIVKKTKELPKQMGDGLKSAGKSLSTAMADVWKEAVKASVAPVNKLLDAANWILKEFGSNKKVISWKPYAKGTDGHKGGNALVNDGHGAELVQMPNGRTFIPRGRDVFLPNAPKGMKVLPAKQTANLLGRKSPTFNYADGTGKIDIWEYYDNAQGLVDKASESVKYDGLSGFRLNLGKSIVSTFKGAMIPWVKKLFDEEGGKSLASYVASKGVEQWRSTVIRALKMEGQYSEANVKRTLYQMQTESGGNPRAINLWDSNAKKGIPSKGLMQCIDPTFKAYARPGFDKNIYDPLSNILASIRYAVSRYGSLAKAYQGHGYAKGVGTVEMPEQSKTISLHYTPENSFGGGSASVTEHNTYAPVFNLTINGDTNDRATERKVKRWISEAMDEVFSSIERKNPRLQEV